MRVASLTCSNTEIMAALGCGKNLIAVDSHSDFPIDIVSSLPRLGPDLNIDLDLLESLKPDLVLASLSVPGMEHVFAGVKARGLNVLVLDPVSVFGIFENVRLVAQALGVAELGERVALEMQEQLQTLAARCKSLSKPPRVMVEWWARPVIVAARDSWVTDAFGLLGIENVFAGIAKRSSVVTTADVLSAAPEIIAVSWCGAKKLRPEMIAARDGWQEIPAVQNNRVIGVPESGLGRPSPRLLEGLTTIVTAALELG